MLGCRDMARDKEMGYSEPIFVGRSLNIKLQLKKLWFCTKCTKNNDHMGPSKICGRQLLKNFTWPILEYFVPYDVRLRKYGLGWTDRRTEGQMEKSDM